MRPTFQAHDPKDRSKGHFERFHSQLAISSLSRSMIQFRS